MSFFTTEEQVYTLFSFCGEIKRIIMGLNKQEKTPCGFCFVEYVCNDAWTRRLTFEGFTNGEQPWMQFGFWVA